MTFSESSPEIDKLSSALVATQTELRAVKQDCRNAHFSSRYTSLKAFIEACRPTLTKHGIAVIQMPYSVQDESGFSIGVTTRLQHESGQWIDSSVAVPAKGRPNYAQEAGSIITYLRRYAYTAMIGVAPGEEDSDGDELGNSPFPDDEGDGETTTSGAEAAFSLLKAAAVYRQDGDLVMARQTLGARSGSAEGSAARVMTDALHAGLVLGEDFKRFSRMWAHEHRQLETAERERSESTSQGQSE